MSKQHFFPTSSSPQFACSAWQSTSYYAAPAFLCNLNKESVMVCDLQGHFWRAVFSPVVTSYLGLKMTISLKQITSWMYNTLQQVHWKWSDGRSNLDYINFHVHKGRFWDVRERVAPFHLSTGTWICNCSILFLLYLDISAYLECISLEVLYLAKKEFISATHREIFHSAQ